MVCLAQIKCTRSKSAGLVFAILGLKIESSTKSRTTPLLMHHRNAIMQYISISTELLRWMLAFQ